VPGRRRPAIVAATSGPSACTRAGRQGRAQMRNEERRAPRGDSRSGGLGCCWRPWLRAGMTAARRSPLQAPAVTDRWPPPRRGRRRRRGPAPGGLLVLFDPTGDTDQEIDGEGWPDAFDLTGVEVAVEGEELVVTAHFAGDVTQDSRVDLCLGDLTGFAWDGRPSPGLGLPVGAWAAAVQTRLSPRRWRSRWSPPRTTCWSGGSPWRTCPSCAPRFSGSPSSRWPTSAPTGTCRGPRATPSPSRLRRRRQTGFAGRGALVGQESGVAPSAVARPAGRAVTGPRRPPGKPRCPCPARAPEPLGRDLHVAGRHEVEVGREELVGDGVLAGELMVGGRDEWGQCSCQESPAPVRVPLPPAQAPTRRTLTSR